MSQWADSSHPEHPQGRDEQGGARDASSSPGQDQPAVNARGAVDLSGLAAEQSPSAPAGQAGAESWALSIDPQALQQVVQLSAQAPVIVLIHNDSEASETMRTGLTDLVDAQQGRLLLALIDAAAHPELAGSADQVPVATAFIGGRPVGEFDASVPTDQLSQLVTQLVQMATQSGMTQRLPAQSRRAEGEEQAEPEIPPLHKKAHEAIEAQDYAAAAEAFSQAIAEQPGDEEAKLGLAQVGLLQRTQDMDAQQVRAAAAEAPDDVEAQIAVSDLDVLGGHVEDAFDRLIRFIQRHPGQEREPARVHLVELYAIVGDADPRVSSSRRKLARVLF